MAPTICSGKKRESRAVLNSNMHRNGQGSHQLNQTLSNIVNHGSLNSRLSTTLRINTHTQSDNSTSGSTAVANLTHRQQQCSFLSDNAVTSSTHSDTENSFDLRLASATPSSDSSPTYNSNTSPVSLSLASTSSSSSSEVAILENERMSAFTSSSYEENRFRRDSTSGNNVMDLCKAQRGNTDEKEANEINSNNISQRCKLCNDVDSADDEDHEDFFKYGMSDGSDADMDTDDSLDFINSLYIENKAKINRNRSLLRDNILAQQQRQQQRQQQWQQQQQQQQTLNGGENRTAGNRRPVARIRNAERLLSIAKKTLTLFQRNKVLQQRLTNLQLETSEFIQSVLSNPENSRFRENIEQCKREEAAKKGSNTKTVATK